MEAPVERERPVVSTSLDRSLRSSPSPPLLPPLPLLASGETLRGRSDCREGTSSKPEPALLSGDGVVLRDRGTAGNGDDAARKADTLEWMSEMACEWTTGGVRRRASVWNLGDTGCVTYESMDARLRVSVRRNTQEGMPPNTSNKEGWERRQRLYLAATLHQLRIGAASAAAAGVLDLLQL